MYVMKMEICNKNLILQRLYDKIIGMKKKIVPRYAYLPIVTCLVWNVLAYNISRLFTNTLTHYDLSLKIDGLIPYVPSFIFIYVLSYPLWILGFWMFAKESRKICNEMFAAEFVSKGICLFFYVLLPTTMERADLSGGGVFNWITGMVYSTDQPNNLFPSIHCMESWLCFRGSLKCRKTHRGYSAIWLVLAILICCSTVFVKQHVFVDIFGGILTAEAGLFISRKFNVGRMYDAVRMPFAKARRIKAIGKRNTANKN